MRLVAVSDLHILGSDDPLYRSLIELVRNLQPQDIFVLAGDVFDLFVGNKLLFRSRYQDFILELERAGERGVQTHYIEGNHDFLLKEIFGALRGVSVYSQQVVLELAGKKFFIAHGDLVDNEDLGYRFLRFFWRSVPVRVAVRVVPGEWIDRIGNRSSDLSKGYRSKQGTAERTQAWRLERLRKIFRSYAADRLAEGFDFVILGHCHDRDEMEFKIGDRLGQYINVGYPRVHGTFLVWEPEENEISRKPLPPF